LTETWPAPVALPLVPSSADELADGGVLQWTAARHLHNGPVPGVRSAIKSHNRVALTLDLSNAIMMHPGLRRYKIAAGLAAVAAIGLASAVRIIPPSGVQPYPALPKAETAEKGHERIGPVRPVRAWPTTTVILEDGTPTELDSILSGYWTLARLMFTGCSTTCPIQGAIFSQAQAELKAAAIEAQLLSISIDPLGDTPAALTKWLDEFGSKAGWHAVIPSLAGLLQLLDVMGGRVDIHRASVYLIGLDAKLYYVTEDLPNPAFLVKLIAEIQIPR
jgi:protein SCO1/2